MSINYKSPEYKLYRLKNRLNYFSTDRPTIYEVQDTKGKFVCSFTNPDYLKNYQTDEYIVIELDLDLEIANLIKEIAYIESTINY